MRIRAFLLGAVIAAVVVPAQAAADTTLGITTQPTGSTSAPCPSSPAHQLLIDINTSSGPSSIQGPLSVPSSSGAVAVSHWAVNAAGISTNEQLTLVVLRVTSAAATPSVSVVGTDTQTLTPPASPAGDVEQFKVAQPFEVQAGDIVGQYQPGSTAGLTCYWGGITGSADELEGLPLSSPPTAGEQLPLGSAGINSGQSDLNLSATLSPLSYDAGLSLSASPSNAVVGQPAVLTATVTNHGPFPGPVTFTDPVPDGLAVDLAGASSGSCTASSLGIVTCSLPAVPVGQSVKVAIVVTPKSAQTYSDTGAVSLPGGGNDPNPANDTATTVLRVSKPGAPIACVVPKLGGASLSLVKRVLPQLGCVVGKVKKASSKSVPSGDVISTNPRAGSYALGRKITLTVSSGKPKKKKHKK